MHDTVIVRNDKGQYYNFVMEDFYDFIEEKYAGNYIRTEERALEELNYIKASANGETRLNDKWIKQHQDILDGGFNIIVVEITIKDIYGLIHL